MRRAGPGARTALIAIAAAAAADLGLMIVLAWLSRAAPAPTPPPLPPLARLSITDPLSEAEQPLAPAQAAAAEHTIAAPSPPTLDLPPLGDSPPLARLELPAIAPTLPVLAATLPAFVSAGAGPAGPVAAPELPPIAALGPGDSPPELLTPINLERFYPRSALRRNLGGETHVQLRVDGDGRVTACEIIASEPVGEFEEAARRLGLSLRYRPERRAGQASACLVPLLIRWSPP